jgi:hypothetical protein
MSQRRLLGLAFVGALAFACQAEIAPVQPVGTVEVTSAPYGIETYPHTFYDGHLVYYSGDAWYYQEGGRWRRYRDEPNELYQYRQRPYVQHAPPAPRYQPYTPYGPTPNALPPAGRTYPY